MIVFDIDTVALKSVVSYAKNANQDIKEALNLLSQIPQHNNWGCNEKGIINNNSQNNRNTAFCISNKSSAFLLAVEAMCNELEEKENSLPSHWQGLEGIISEITQIGSQIETVIDGNGGHSDPFHSVIDVVSDVIGTTTITSPPITVIKSIADKVKAITGGGKYPAFESFNPARIVSFIDLKE